MSDSIIPSCKHLGRWLVPAIVAFIAFVGGVASNLVATDLEAILPSYRIIVWSIFVIALITAVVIAIWEARKTSEQSAPEADITLVQNRSVTIGGDAKRSTIITGDKNVTNSDK